MRRLARLLLRAALGGVVERRVLPVVAVSFVYSGSVSTFWVYVGIYAVKGLGWQPGSVGRLFLGGAIPGTLMGLYLMVVVYLLARRRGYVAAPRASGAALWASTKAAALPLLMPVIILGGIFSGIATPTESAGIAVAYALLLGAVVYRAFTWASQSALAIQRQLRTMDFPTRLKLSHPFFLTSDEQH